MCDDNGAVVEAPRRQFLDVIIGTRPRMMEWIGQPFRRCHAKTLAQGDSVSGNGSRWLRRIWSKWRRDTWSASSTAVNMSYMVASSWE
jgi:hypothetical protein